MVVVLRLDQGDGDVRLVVENVVGALGLAAGDQLAADDDPAFGEIDLFANLRQDIPARLLDGGRDELGADVAFAERLLVESRHFRKHQSAKGFWAAEYPFPRGKSLQLGREFALEMEPLASFEAQRRGAEKYIFSVLLPTLCLHGDRLEGGWCVSG